VIVDNDPEHAGLDTARRLATSLPFRLKGVCELQTGIPFARNRLIEEVRHEDFDFLLTIDDDEYPSTGWLDAMIAKAQTSQADIVGGPVCPVFSSPVEWPVTAADYTKPGGRLRRGNAIVESTANILFTRRLIDQWQQDWFRAEFSKTGGSDTEFLRRTAAAGHRHAIAEPALVYEDIPCHRAKPEWLVRRSHRNGRVLARARTMHRGPLQAAVIESVNAGALVAQALVDVSCAPTNARARLIARLKLARAAGKLAGLRR
jgi:glycosyltransferase involved in cell wall biosynthesis